MNNIHVHVGGGKLARSKVYSEWRDTAGYLLNVQRYKPTRGTYELELRAVRPDKKKRDLGNLEKAVSDLLVTHGVVQDDSFCERIVMMWVKPTFEGIQVTVRGELAPVRKASHDSKS